jgi:hypothetical protein
MRRTQSRAGPARRLPILFVAGIVALAGIPCLVAQSPPSVRPGASQPTEAETVDAALRRLRQLSPEKMTRQQLALRAGLQFCVAVGKPDGAHAVELVDVVGYQALPLSGPLPEKPHKPIDRQALQSQIDARQPARVGDIPAECFEALPRESLRRSFPAVARWMLPHDLALVIEPPNRSAANWVTRRCCIVVRVRGSNPAVIGGNLFEALPPPAKPGE